MSRRSSRHTGTSNQGESHPRRGVRRSAAILLLSVAAIAVLLVILNRRTTPPVTPDVQPAARPLIRAAPGGLWIQRARAVDRTFQAVFTPCWEGAYGAIGDAYLFAVTQDSALLQFFLRDHPLTAMCEGRWVDDVAWVCLAEEAWWRFTGRSNNALVGNALRRYEQVREEGRLSRHEGFWSWYNWPPTSVPGEKVFTNSNMNEMACVACWLYEATGEKRYLDDALLVWNGDARAPGVEKEYYRGNGRWVGTGGHASFGNPLPWQGAGYCSVAASLFRVTGDQKYKTIAVATARRLMDPKNGWVDPVDFYQIHMDGNGAFVNFILDAYQIAPGELRDIPGKVEKMLNHVWSNAGGKAKVILHREPDDGIRNGWNPLGGEQGYGVDEVGTAHAQGEAVRAFGLFAYVDSLSRGAAAPHEPTSHQVQKQRNRSGS